MNTPTDRCDPNPPRVVDGCFALRGGERCGKLLYFRPGSGPGHREVFCERHGRMNWPPRPPRCCYSTDDSGATS